MIWPGRIGLPRKKLTEQAAHALIVQETRYRLGCEGFAPVLTLRRAEPDTSGRYASANWDADAEGVAAWPRDCAQAFQEAVLRNRGKFDIAWRR